MTHHDFSLEPSGDSTYEATVPSLDGSASITLRLDGLDAASDGRLSEDEPTARAVLHFLLEHQDAADLPQEVDAEQVLAAYPDAVDGILARRG